MKEVFPNLFVGSMDDCGNNEDIGAATLHACQTCHKRVCGITKPTDPDYLWYQYGRDMYLNIVDADKFLSGQVVPVETGLAFVNEQLTVGNRVVIHCDQGHSRSATIAMLVMIQRGALPKDFMKAAEAFYKIYPNYIMVRGMMEIAKRLISSGRV